MGLCGSETHGITPFETVGFLPQFGVGEPVVESGECEGAEWELGEEACLIILVLSDGIVVGALVPDKVVGCQLGL